jgi:drug/metabolite transporter (DMT)-like permease
MTGTGAPGRAPARPRVAGPLAIWTALSVVYLVWGSTYLAIRVVVDSAPPLLAMGVRFVAAGLLLATYVVIRRGVRGLAVTRGQLGSAAVVGALLLLGGNGGVAVAEQVVPSGIAALIIAATPLWLVLLRTAFADRVAGLTLAGTAVGFVGIALLVLPGDLVTEDGEPVRTWGLLVLIGAAASWALGSFVSSRLDMPGDAFVATTWQMLVGGGALALAGLASGELSGFSVGDVSGAAWAWLVYLVVVGSLVAYSAYVWLLGNAPISLTATYAYVNPVVAVLLGALLLDEPVTAAVVGGGAVVVAGVGLVVTSERPRQQKEQEPVR